MAYIAEPSGRQALEGEGADRVGYAEPSARADEPVEPMPASRNMNRSNVRCLLMHGFNGEPVDMWELEERLSELGYAAKSLLLPGHGTSIRDFAQHGWDDWFGHVREEARRA